MAARRRVRQPKGTRASRHRGMKTLRRRPTSQFMDRVANEIVDSCMGTGKIYLVCCMAKQACQMRGSARYIRLSDLLMERNELAVTERSDAKILKKYVSYELLVIDE